MPPIEYKRVTFPTDSPGTAPWRSGSTELSLNRGRLPLQGHLPLWRQSRSGSRALRGALRAANVLQLVRLTQPIGDRRFNFVPGGDPDHVRELRLRSSEHAPHLRRPERPRKHDANLEESCLRANEEIADLAREHDRMVRRINPLLAKLHGGFAQPLPCVLQV